MENKKLASARIEPLDNGYLISGVALAEDQGAARHVDNNFNSVFPTWAEASDYLRENIASPQDIIDLKNKIRAKREEGLVSPLNPAGLNNVVN